MMRKITFAMMLCAMLCASAQTIVNTPVAAARHAQKMGIAPVTTQPITDEPSGEKSDRWARDANYWIPYGESTYQYLYESAIGSVVVNSGENAIYIQYPWMQFEADTWIRGEISGETVTLKLPQAVYDYEGTMLYMAKMVYNEITDDDGNITDVEFYVDSINPNVEFVYRNDSLVQVGSDKLAMIDGEGNWYGYCEDTWVFHKIKAEVATNEGMEMEPYVLRYVKSKRYKYIDILGSKTDNAFYLAQLSENLPNSVVKGDVNGNTVTFKAGQYLGADYEKNLHMFFTNAAYDDEEYLYFGGIDLVMNYDESGDTLLSEEGNYFCINPGTHMVASAYRWENPVIFKYSEPTDQMPDPTYTKVYAYDSEEGYGEMRFDIPLTSASGQVFAPSKVYYNIYLDDTKLTMTPDVYEMLEEDMVDIPYNYDDDYDVMVQNKYHDFYYYQEVKKVGVCAFYVNDGKVNTSNIVWYDLETGEVTTSSGINDVVAQSGGNVVSVEYFDLTGKRVSDLGTGVYIKRVTMDNGTTTTTKVLR